MLMMMLHRRFRPKSISLPKVFSLLTSLKVPSPLVATSAVVDHWYCICEFIFCVFVKLVKVPCPLLWEQVWLVFRKLLLWESTTVPPIQMQIRSRKGNGRNVNIFECQTESAKSAKGQSLNPESSNALFLLFLFPQLLINDSSGFPAFPSGNQHHCATTINKGNSVKKKTFLEHWKRARRCSCS